MARAIDPLTGEALRMVWWCRWFAAVLAIFLFIALGALSSPPQSQPDASASREGSAPVSTPTPQQLLDARLALCAAVADEYQDAVAGKHDKDTIILANQFSVGERAGGVAIGHEWFAYKDGEWHDSDCHGLSIASWAAQEGYAGDPIDLPDGAIATVVGFQAGMH